jgi:hypothetical protein
MKRLALGCWIATVFVSGIAYWTTYRDAERQFVTGYAQCEGIGFGCTLSPESQAFLTAGAVLVLGMLISLIVVVVTARSRRRRRSLAAPDARPDID